MKTHQHHFHFSKSLLALAVLAAYAPAYADDAEIARLTQPESSITVGVGATNGNQDDRAVFGQYNGLRENKGTLQLDVDITKRDNAAGTTLILKGSNLGLDGRDLSFAYEKQGDWKIGADYSDLTHRELRTINTGLQGAGTTTPTVVRLATPGTGQDVNLKFKRVGMGLSAEKWISNNLQLEVSLRNEDKTGARTFGTGYACAAYVCNNAQNNTLKEQTWALLMLPEPVDSTTRQIEAKLNYHVQQLNVSAGYYGSFYNNANGSMQPTVPNVLNNPLGDPWTLSPAKGTNVIAGGGLSLQNVMQLPIALTPDNEAHQFYVSGNYRFAPTTVATFKYAHTRAKQNQDFAASGLAGAPAGVTSLGGVVDTTLLQLGVTSRPMPRLNLLANLRYEDKNDKTPEALYNVEGKTSTPATVPPYINAEWFNAKTSATKVTGKLEAGYQVMADTRATIGVDYHSLKRPVPTSAAEDLVAGLGALRAKNEETGYRLELRRSMSDTLSGSIGYSSSKRKGSDWTSLSTNAAFAAAGLGYGKTGSASQFLALSAGNAFPMNMVDLDREKFKLSANWMPSERVEIQFSADDGKDKNTTAFNEIALGKSWRESRTQNYSLDASFAVSDNWKITAYAAQGEQTLKVNHSTGYMADLKTRTDSFGLGVNGKASSQLELGANVGYVKDNTHYGLAASPTTTGTLPNITQVAPSAANLAQVAIGVPDVMFESTTFSLFGKYSLNKNADVRVNLAYQRNKFNEWSWGYNGRAFVFQDNTTLSLKPNQSVTYIGAAYIYRF